MSLLSALHLPAYAGFVAGQFRKMLAYRTRYVTGIVSYLVYVTTHFFLWRAIWSRKPAGAEIGGFTAEEMVTYVVVGWVARSFYFNNVDRELSEQVQNGSIAVMLARPVSLQGTVAAGALGEGMFRFLFFTVPIGAAIFLLFPVRAPASALHGVAFLLSCTLALAIVTQINFLVGLCAFPLKNIDGVMRAKHYLIELLSGLLIPVALFPGWLRGLSAWLPFQAVSFLPGSIWLGRARAGVEWLGGGETLVARALAAQLAWVVALTLLGGACWRLAARRLTVQGG